MKNLLEVIAERAKDKNLQIVFTTHRESIVELSNLLNIRHIVNKAEKTFCFNETKPDAIHRLTGKQEKLIEVFVEDDLATAIVNKIVSSLKIKKHVSIKKFGAAQNCFTTVAGILLSKENIDNSLFVLDGDVFTTSAKKLSQIKNVLTGHGNDIESYREKAMQHIKEFKLPEGTKPEPYLHSLLIGIQNPNNEEFNEILEVANGISHEQDSHKYLLKIIERLDYEKAVGYSKIIDFVSTHPQWEEYVSEIYSWLKSRVSKVREADTELNQTELLLAVDTV